jgi:hypothetical protein
MTSPCIYVRKSSLIILRSLLHYNPSRFLLLFCLLHSFAAVSSLLCILCYQGTITAVALFVISTAVLLLITIISLPVTFSYGDFPLNSRTGGAD